MRAAGRAPYLLIALLAACGGGGGSSPGVAPNVTPGSTTPAPATTTPAPGTTAGPGTPTPTSKASATPRPTQTPAPGGTTPSPAPTAAAASCAIFPANNPWNTDISGYPLDPHSADYMAQMNPSGANLHPDFGSDPTYGIPYNIVNIAPAAFKPITFDSYASESDPGPYPIPANPAIEAGTDLHMLIVDENNCKLYETAVTYFSAATGWHAAGGAVFDLTSNALRPDTWTSADAAGLPIYPGLARYDEATAGNITHALRFTMAQTAHGFIHPATHQAGNSSATYAPPMGLRLRLKSSFNISAFHGSSLAVLKALQRYGMFLADNGSNFYISGSTDTRWDDNDLNQLKTVPAGAFEVVNTGPTLH